MAIERRTVSQIVPYGIIGGIVAGIVFAMAEMVMAVLMGGDFFGPLRMIGSIVLGTAALAPTYPLATALIVGMMVHLVLSAIYGVVFVSLINFTNQLNASAGLVLPYGAVYGLALWVLNFLIIAPVAWPQFTMVDQFWMGFVAHTFFFGLVLGGYVAAARPGLVAAQQ